MAAIADNRNVPLTVKINGLEIRKCWHDVTDIKCALRTDTVPVPGKHYPMVRQLGYDLFSFRLTVEAFTNAQEDEMEAIFQSIFATVPDVGGAVRRLKPSKIEYDYLNRRGVNLFLPADVSPPNQVNQGDYAAFSVTLKQASNTTVGQFQEYIIQNEVGGVPVALDPITAPDPNTGTIKP